MLRDRVLFLVTTCITLVVGGTLLPPATQIAIRLDAAARTAQPSLSVWSLVFSKTQADRGEQAYRSACGYCHKDDLSGGFTDDGVGRAVALAGPQAFGSSFVERWRDQTLADMVYVIASTMPKQAPTSLNLDTYVDIVTFLLERNGVPAGDDELPADVPTLRDIVITAPPK